MVDTRALAAIFAATKVLVVDDEHYMRKVVRTLLMSTGVRTIYEAVNGSAGLDLIRSVAPDVVIVDWEMPGIDGAEFVRIVRSPATFPPTAGPTSAQATGACCLGTPRSART